MKTERELLDEAADVLRKVCEVCTVQGKATNWSHLRTRAKRVVDAIKALDVRSEITAAGRAHDRGSCPTRTVVFDEETFKRGVAELNKRLNRRD